MNWIEIDDLDGQPHLLNVNHIIKVVEETSYHITDSDVATPIGKRVRIYLRGMSYVRANWSLNDMKEILLHHRLGKPT